MQNTALVTYMMPWWEVLFYYVIPVLSLVILAGMIAGTTFVAVRRYKNKGKGKGEDSSVDMSNLRILPFESLNKNTMINTIPVIRVGGGKVRPVMDKSTSGGKGFVNVVETGVAL